MSITFEVCVQKIEKWLSEIQRERKCTHTNDVCNSIDKLVPAQQAAVSQLLSINLTKLINSNFKAPTAADLNRTCNALNGCFDNFPYAVNAIKLIFGTTLKFICFGIKHCHDYLGCDENNPMEFSKINVVETLHELSRLSTLLLKLKRKNGEVWAKDADAPSSTFNALSILCTEILSSDKEITCDIKINLATALCLMKEIGCSSDDELAKIHDKFISTLPKTVESTHTFSCEVKFVMSVAAIGLWNDSIINEVQISAYLNFFCLICEGSPSNALTMITTCRALQILGRHPSFMKYNLSESECDRIAALNVTLLEHPVPCVRHAARALLAVLLRKKHLKEEFLVRILSLPVEQKAYFIGLSCLSVVYDTRDILAMDPAVPSKIMTAITDPTCVSHVASAAEYLAVHDGVLLHGYVEWCETWIVPLVKTLANCLPIIAAEIEKILGKILVEHAFAIEYVLDQWETPGSNIPLKGMLTCLRSRSKLKSEVTASMTSYTDLISKRDGIFEMSLHHADDNIRLSAFGLLAEGPLTTEEEMHLVLVFLKYNLNNVRPATRQKIISFFKKVLTRANRLYLTLQRPSKNRTTTVTSEYYVEFLRVLVEICYCNIFPGANFNRMNTVLTILTLCVEILDPALLDQIGHSDARRWPKCVIALESTYEENKSVVVQLCKRMTLEHMDEPTLRQDLREVFGKIQELEPPTVLLGTYKLCVLMKAPLCPSVLRQYFGDGIESPSENPELLVLQILTRFLNLQIDDAEKSLLVAARQSPMYGTMFAIRQILNALDATTLSLEETKSTVQQLVHMCFKMADIVSSVVNNSSPEGHLPMDFQRLVDDTENEAESGLEKTYSAGSESEVSTLKQLEKAYKRADSAELKLELAEKIRSYLQEKVDKMQEHDDESSLTSQRPVWRALYDRTKNKLLEYDCYCKFFEGQLPRFQTERPLTAQALLLCAWRTMKEACLLLGDVVSKLPLKDAVESGFLTEELIIMTGEKLRLLLSEIKHRGAFEQAGVSFTALSLALWQCPLPHLHQLPLQWLNEVLREITLLPDDQKVKFTSTRRSAGLPFLIQALIVTEIASGCSTNGRCLTLTMEILLKILEHSTTDNIETRLHASNIVRALFKHAQLGEFVAPYVSRALQIAIRGSRSATWPERNCSNMLFSSLVIRIFGVARSRDQLSKKNQLTTRVFFQRFPDLYQCFVEEMSLVKGGAMEVYPQPSLYLVLLIMRRLYLPTTPEPNDVDMQPFLEVLIRSASNPVFRIRALAAQALVPLIPPSKLNDKLICRLEQLKEKERKHVTSNVRHGLLLQVREILECISKQPKPVTTVDLSSLNWMICLIDDSCRYYLPGPVLHAYVQVLRTAWRNFDECKELIENLVKDTCDWTFLTFLAKEKEPFIEPFLSELLLLQLDILSEGTTKNWVVRNEQLWAVVWNLRTCGIPVLENIILSFLYCVLSDDRNPDLDFSLVEGSVENLKCFSTPANITSLRDAYRNEMAKYMKEEQNSIKQCSVLQQRRLRIVLLDHITDEISRNVVSLEPKISEAVHFYLKFWEHEEMRKAGADCSRIYLFSTINSGYHNMMLYQLLHGDQQCRFALAKAYGTPWWIRIGEQSETGPETIHYWFILFRLLIDEDEKVRTEAEKAIATLCDHIKQFDKYKKVYMQKNVLPLRAQEYLIKFFILIYETSVAYPLLVAMAIFSITITESEDDDEPRRIQRRKAIKWADPLERYNVTTNARTHIRHVFYLYEMISTYQIIEIFKRGNPNPFGERVALTRIFVCGALTSADGKENYPTLEFLPSVAASVKQELSPIFARHGLKINDFTTTSELLRELSRLDPTEKTASSVFRAQIGEIMTLLDPMP